jgi:RHS repeat-associated protein
MAVSINLDLSPKYFLSIFPSLRVNDTTWNPTTSDYNRSEDTETAYLVVAGASYGRVVYDDTVPMTGTSASHVYLQMTDALGSSSSVIDLASSQVVEQMTYLPYGGTETDYRPSDWDSFRESYRFTGKEDDYEVGLVYFGQRYLFPALGRWASADPLNVHGLAGEPNPYTFVSGSPLRFTDDVGFQDSSPDGTSESGTESEAATLAASLPPAPVDPYFAAYDEVAQTLSQNWQDELDATIAQTVYNESLACAPSTPAQFQGGVSPEQAPGGAGLPLTQFTIVNAGLKAAMITSVGPASGQDFMNMVEPQWVQTSRSYALGFVLAGAFVPRAIWGIAATVQFTQIQNSADSAGIVSGVTLGLGALGTAPVGVDVNQALTEHMNSAVARFAERGFTPAQTARIATNPNMEAAFRGERIDTFFKQAVENDPTLQHLSITPRFQFGPDVFDPNTATWWDVTTPAQWGAHVEKYSGQFGTGIPLLYGGF